MYADASANLETRRRRLLVFCPNCGTRNADTELKCAQCGFELRQKGEQPRFKGTMVMEGQPQRTGSEQKRPQDQPPARQGAQQQQPGKGDALKGTMIGVAPPEMQEALDAARARAAGKSPPQGQGGAPRAPKESAGEQGTSRAKAGLKGTMMGVAPPDMQGAIAAAKAGTPPNNQRQAPRDANPEGSYHGKAVPGSAGQQKPAPNPSAGRKAGLQGTMMGVAPPNPPSTAAGPQPKAPSQLKGTMMGVAPPDMQTAIQQAKQGTHQRGAEQQAGRQQKGARQEGQQPTEGVSPAGGPAGRSKEAEATGFGETLVGRASPEAAAEHLAEKRQGAAPASPDDGQEASKHPPSEVNAFGGTLVGTSPFARPEANPPEEPVPNRPPIDDSPDQVGASDRTGAMAAAAPTQQMGSPAGIPASPENFARTFQSNAPPPSDGRVTAQGASPLKDSVLGASSPGTSGKPGLAEKAGLSEKKSGSPVVLLIVAVVVVGALISLTLALGSSDAENAEEELPPESEETTVGPDEGKP